MVINNLTIFKHNNLILLVNQ